MNSVRDCGACACARAHVACVPTLRYRLRASCTTDRSCTDCSETLFPECLIREKIALTRPTVPVRFSSSANCVVLNNFSVLPDAQLSNYFCADAEEIDAMEQSEE